MSLNVPLKLTIKDELKTIAVIGDTHFPFHDPEAIDVMEDILFEIQPDYLIYNGDIGDWYQVSKFAKDPVRISQLQNDLDMVKTMFAYHGLMLPNTRRIFIKGTHENRWEKWLWQRTPETAGLESNAVESLYGLKNNGIECVEFEQGLLVNGVFLILHGNIVSIHSAYTAKRQFERNGGCGICNHTHRGGSFYKRDRFGTWGWWVNFCLCSLNPDWIQNPNWQQGFSLVHFTGSKRFWVEQIPIINHEALYNGKLYGGG